jgi:hypothetical protein
MAARQRRTIEIGITERTFIRDLPRPAAETPGFEFFLWTRLGLEVKDPTLFGPDSILGAIWTTGGAEVIREIGVTQAKLLRCWNVFGDPRK